MDPPWVLHCCLFSAIYDQHYFVVVKNEHLRNKNGIYDPCGRVFGSWKQPITQPSLTSSKQVKGHKGIPILIFSLHLQHSSDIPMSKVAAGRKPQMQSCK